MALIAFSSNTCFYLYNFKLNTLLRLKEAGFSVVCFAPEDHYTSRLSELGFQVISIPLSRSGVNFLRELSTILFIFRALRKLSPRYVFNSTIKMNLYFGLSSSALGIPYSNNISGLGTAFIHKKVFFKVVQWLYGCVNLRADHVFFQNEEDRDLFLERGLVNAKRQSLIPGSGVDVSRFSYSPVPLTGQFTFLMISRLIADKGVREYVEASTILRKGGINARFLLLGPTGIGNRSAIPESEVKSWVENGDIEWIGEQKDVVPWIKSSHVIVLPSYREGLPKAVIEAAAVGRPAIVSDVPGCRQAVIDNETGWLCCPRSAKSLAERMRLVYQQSVTNYGWLQGFGSRASLRAISEFSEEIVIKAHLACLQSKNIENQSS